MTKDGGNYPMSFKRNIADLHQILAYASLFNKSRIVSILVYPLTGNTYTKLASK